MVDVGKMDLCKELDTRKKSNAWNETRRERVERLGEILYDATNEVINNETSDLAVLVVLPPTLYCALCFCVNRVDCICAISIEAERSAAV